MKILWFTNVLMPELSEILCRKKPVYGGWMISLLDAIRGFDDVEIAVATIDLDTKKLTKNFINGVTYFCLPIKRVRGTQLTSSFVSDCSEAIKVFNPDIIHVHGTEEIYGLFAALGGNSCPTIISIQGLIHVCSRYVNGGLNLMDYLDAGKDGFLAWLYSFKLKYNFVRRGKSEQEIIRRNQHFIGRTLWDKAHVKTTNPLAQYYYGGEILRPEFYDTPKWDIRNIRRYSIFCTAASAPLKGFHLLLYAVIILRNDFPNIKVKVAGAPWDDYNGTSYYGRYIKKLIRKYNLSKHIEPLPLLESVDIANELIKANTFVIPSLIENSPNSLAEAMILGVPSIAAFVGGIPSMVEDEESALCFPSGDVAYLAHAIRRIFTDDELSQHISKKARAVALNRHDPKKIATLQIELYRLLSAS